MQVTIPSCRKRGSGRVQTPFKTSMSRAAGEREDVAAAEMVLLTEGVQCNTHEHLRLRRIPFVDSPFYRSSGDLPALEEIVKAAGGRDDHLGKERLERVSSRLTLFRERILRK